MEAQKVKKDKIEMVLLFLFGFFGTMPIVQLKGLTAFTVLILLLVGYNILTRNKIYFTRSCMMCVIIFASCICSSLVCYFSDLPAWWKSEQVPELVWQVLYVLVFLFYAGGNSDKIKIYIKGVYYASIVHMLWGFLQFLAFKANGTLINDVIFVNMLHMVDSGSHVADGVLKLSGLCWNAGNVAPIIIIGYALSNNNILKLMFIFFSFISGSRTLLTGIVACIGVECVFWTISTVRNFKVSEYRKKLAVAALIVAAVVVGLNSSAVTEKITHLIESVSSSNIQTESSARLHTRYWTSVPYITRLNTLPHNLFGFGMKSSGYAQVLYYGQYADSAYAWVLECDFINILWSRGYIGFLLVYAWLGYYIIIASRKNKRYAVFFAGLLIEGITYNVMFNWCWIFILAIIIICENGDQLPEFQKGRKLLRVR